MRWRDAARTQNSRSVSDALLPVHETPLMPFIIRPFRRFPVQCPVSYYAGPSKGNGTLWNFSVNGWKLSGDVPLEVGQLCSLTVTLPNEPSFVVSAAIVRWARDREYGLETLAIDKQVHSRLEQVIEQLEQESGDSVP